MIGRDHTYFHPTLCLDPHFIVTGYTNDIFCTDELQIVHVEEELHQHLRRQGFDAVLFLDLNRGLHCYDEQSACVFETGNLPGQRPPQQQRPTTPAQAADDEFSDMDDGPLSGARRPAPQPEPEQAPPQPVQAAHQRLNFALPTLTALGQAVALLESNPLRCALVLNNITALQRYMSMDSASAVELVSRLNSLMQLSSFQTTNHSIVVYLFRDSELLNARELQGNSAAFSWILQSRLESRDAHENRLISLRTPNAAEMRNFLNHLRLYGDRPIPVRAEDLERLAITFAGACSRKNWTLNRLLLGIENFYADRAPERPPLSMDCWMDVMDDHNYVPAMERLNRMVGLTELKAEIKKWHARMRQQSDGPVIPERSNRFTAPELRSSNFGHKLNVQLRGGAGTGKTTVARIIGEIYYDLGLLPQGHFVETSAADLVSPNVGETAGQVHAAVLEAMGGVLFIDEAYQLTSNAHGREAIDQLVADTSRYEGQFAVIIAGYSRDIERFIDENEGLSRRFPTVFELPDYSGQEMRQLLEMALERAPERVRIAPSLQDRLDDFCQNWVNGRRIRNWGNAGEANNLAADLIANCSARMSGAHADELVITAADMPERLRDYLTPTSANLAEALNIVDNMIGLHSIKRFLHRLCNNVQLGVSQPAPGNYIFYGPPGTGKTTVGKRMAEILHHLNVLPTNRFQYCQAQDLLQNRTDRDGRPLSISEILDEEIENAWRGVLFIDEAHQLADTDEGRQVIKALVPKIDDPVVRANVCIICAGYAKEMRDFLAVDKGLDRRFPVANRVRFENYTPHELRQILEQMARESGDVPQEAYLDRSEIAMGRFLENNESDFGNGGYIRDTYLPESRAARQNRLVRLYSSADRTVLREDEAALIETYERTELTAEDIPARMADLAGPIGQKPPPERDAIDLAEDLVGKEEVKRFVRGLRANRGGGPKFLDGAASTLHAAIAGPNGSGRHTVARTLARVWKQLDLLETRDVKTASRANMVAGYIGQTAGTARSVIEEAVGGTLIVEYPSSMLPGERNTRDFGPEALGVLAGAMNRTDLSIILIDSEEGMERLFQSNSAFRSRLAAQFTLEDPTPEEMLTLFRMQTRESMVFDAEVEALLPDFFQNWTSDRGGSETDVRSWGNALEIPRLVNTLKDNWTEQEGEARELEPEGADSTEAEAADAWNRPTEYRRLITRAMFPEKVVRYLRSSRASAETALSELDQLTGLRRVKDAVHRIERGIRFTSRDRVIPGFYCFIGNPGTGKTTVARLMGGVLRSVRALEKGHVIERTAQEMMQSPDQFDKTLKLARDGVLFIDEAHQLVHYNAGAQVLQRLLTVLEDTEIKRRTCIILAGYPREMMHLIQTDSGLSRRFGTADSLIWFDDYSPEELVSILDDMARRADRIPEIGAPRPLRISPEFRVRSERIFREICAKKDPNFGNAGFVRNYLHDALAELYARLDVRQDDYTFAEADTLTEADIPAQYRRLDRAKPAQVPASMISTEKPDEESLRQCGRWAVFLQCLDEKGNPIGSGTGGIVTREGHVLTCAHVVQGAASIRARVNTPGAVGGDYFDYDCEILRPIFEDCDMALLHMKGKNFPAAPLRPADEPIQPQEHTLLPGYPLGARLSEGDVDALTCNVFEGTVSSQMTLRSGVERCYIDSRGLHGNSGSPVFSRVDGRLIGVFSGSVRPEEKTNPDELNYFYPIRYFWERFVQRKAGGEADNS